MNSLPTRDALARASELEVSGTESTLRVTRRRSLPSRGVFRLLIPRVVARVDTSSPIPDVSVSPDALAWFMLVTCAGAVLGEFTMDRVKYPRDYPPAFVFALAAFYLGALVLEMVRTQSAIDRALR